MRWARSRRRWLLSACLISLLLLTPTDCDGLQLVLAVKKNSMWPPSSSSSSSSPSLITTNQIDDQLHHKQLLEQKKVDVEQQQSLLQLTSNNGFKLPFASSSSTGSSSSSAEASEASFWSNYESEHTRPLVASIKKSSKKKGDDDSSGAVVGIAVAVVALVVVIIIYFACRGTDESASPYDLGRDDKPLLGLTAGSSRKSCATPIDVSRLGALPSDNTNNNSGESDNQFEVKLLPMRSHIPPASKLKSAGAMSMKAELAERHSRLASHEVTTIAGRPAGSATSQDDEDAASSSTAAAAASGSGSTVVPAGPKPPPLPGGAQRAPPPPPPPGRGAAAPPPPPPPGAAPPPPPPAPAPAPAAAAAAAAPAPPPPPRAAAAPGPPPPPAPRGGPGPGAGPGPPPPPLATGGPPGGGPPPPALPGGPRPRGPPPLKKPGAAAVPQADSSKTKLKPFFWDKVTANPNQAMVWDQIKAGSFQFNEEAIETLFGCNAVAKKSNDGKKDAAAKEAVQFVRILEPKKAQNLAISLKALSVSAKEVRNAVTDGNDLPSDLVQTVLRWAPTSDEELRLRLYTGESTQLGHAEQFLKTIIDVPYIFQRLDVLLFMATLPEEAAGVKQSFETLEVACHELRHNRLFKKLLEAVLKTGNRMNDGTFRGGAQAFKLDTLLKLADVKGIDGKTTLLHFVVQEIIRSEGVRAVRAAKDQQSNSSDVSSVGSSDQDLTEDVSDDTEHYKQLGLGVVSSLGDDLQNVRKAACLDADALTIMVASLGHRLVKANEFLNTAMKSLEEDSGFHRRLVAFIEKSQVQVTHLLEEEKKMRALVRTTVDYFQGSTGKDEGLRLFVIVRDFLTILDKVCREVKEAAAKAAAANKKLAAAATAATPASTSRGRQPSQTSMSFRDPRQHLKPAVQGRRAAANNDSSSSSDSDD